MLGNMQTMHSESGTARCGNAGTPWMNMNDSCYNETRSCQDDTFWYITRSYEQFCYELEQNKNEFLFGNGKVQC